MRILHIIPDLKKGGAERLALDICSELSKRTDVELRLLTFSEENSYKFLSYQIHHDVIPSKVLPSISGKPIIEIDKLLKYISDFKPDILHSHLFEAELVSRWKIFPGIKYFTHCHDNMRQFTRFSFTDIFQKKRMTDLYERKLLFQRYIECGNHFIAISKHTEEFLKNNLSASLRDQVVLLNNAINYSKFNIPHFESDRLNLVNVGSFVPKKNQKFFIPLAKELIKKNIDFKIFLLGDGPLRNEFIAELKKNHLEQYFELPGNVDNVQEYYAKSKIYIHSAIYEPFGLVLLEAMVAGLPVVCLDGGGNRDIINNNENGYIIKNNDPHEFLSILLHLINDDHLYQKISHDAKEFSRQYDIVEYVNKLLYIYSQHP